MKGIATAILIGLFVFWATVWFFEAQHAVILGIVAFLVALWTNEALPLGVVSLLPILLFPAFGILDVASVTSNYSKSIIFLFLGGFMLAIAMEKIGLHRYFSAKLLSFFPHTPRGIIYALAITSALLSAILSNTTITLMLMPIALFLTEDRVLRIRFLLAVAYGASIGGILTPIGTAPNLILLGFLEEQGVQTFSFGEWMLTMAPVVALMLWVAPALLSWGVANRHLGSLKQEKAQLDSTQRRLYVILGVLSAVLIGNTFAKQLLGFMLDEKMILLGFGLLMFMPKIGFLEWEDTRKIPYEIIFLFGAGFSIAMAFSQSGLAKEITLRLDFITTVPFFVMLLLTALFVAFSTEVTSNTALTSIAIPIFWEFAKTLPLEQGVVMLLVATASASYAFMLPIATPPNAIVMSSRVIPIKTMASIGFWLNLTGIILLSTVAYLFW